ncbi:MAG: hypothetical protein J6V68_00220, partial [Clostridia bacterium]|nr:hypothetical protein [Clostridia bacterium]
GKIVWLQTRIVNPSATFSAENGGTYIQIGAEQMTWGTVYDPTVSTNDGWRIRWGIASWTKYDLTADEYTAYKNGELDIAVSVGENAVYGYVKTASSSVWRLVGSKTGSYNGVTAIRTNHSSVASQAKNVQYAIDGFTDTGLVTVNTTVSSGSESGTATAGMANLGGKLIIKQSAASGYSLSEVKVNGVSYPDAVLAAKGTDNDITIKNVEYAEEINVEVVFVQSSTTKTFNFDVKEKFIGQDDSTATNVNGGNIYFYSTTGGESFGGTIANGTVSISLSNGTYEVKSDKALGSVTVQIANGAIVGSNTLYFGKSIFVDSDNNYNVSATNAGYTLTIKDPNTAIKADPAISLVSGIDAYTTTHISFNYVSSSTDSGTGYFPTLKFMGETDFLAIQLCHWGTSLGWKWASDHALGLDKDGDGTASNSEKGTGVTIWNGSFTNKSVRIDIYILGNDVSLYVDGEYSYSFNCLTIWGSQYDSFEIINFGISYRIDALSGHKDWEMNSFKVVEEDVPNAIVTFNGTALTSNTLTKDGLTLTTSAYPVKTTKNVTYTLATGDVGGDLVKITDLIVKVNGVAVDVTLSNNSFTYKIQSVAKDTTLEIIVETALVGQLTNVELDLNKVYAINGNVTKTAYAGTVTVRDNNSNSNTYTATAGKVTIPTMETGKYTVSIDDANYLTAELNAEKGVNSYALDFNYSMFKVAAVVGGAWNTDVLAGMYDVSDAVNGNLDFNNTSTAGDAYMIFNPELGQIKYVEATVTLNSKALANNEQWITFASAGYGLNTDIYGKTYTVSSKGSYAFRYVANGVDGSTANNFTVRGIDSLGWPQLPVKEVTSESELSYTIKMAIYVDGTNVYMYYAQVGQPLKLWQTKTAKFDRIVSINAYRNTNFQISDLMLYNEAPERAISYTATNGVTYANDNPAKVSIASTATIKVKADNGVVSSVKVNGIALSTETAQDGYVSAVIDPKVIGISEDFVITTELATTFAGTLSLNVDNGEYTDKVLTDGDVVTLTMATTGYKLTGTIANGSVSFDEIIAGTYDIAVDGAKADFRNVSAVTFASDDADKTATVKLVIGNLYKGEAVDDLDAVNGNLTISREMSSPVTLYQFADYMGDIVYAEATITSTVSNISRKEDFHTGFVTPLAVNNSTHGLTFGTRFSPAGGADNTNSTTSTWQVRVMRTDAQPNYWNNTHISGSADKDTVTIRFVYAIDPSKSVTHLYYAPSADADLIYYGQFATANQNKLFGLICMAEGEYSTITDLKISTSVPAYLAPVNVTFSGETDKASVETGTTESVAWGEEGKVVVSTQVGYAVSNITVNGTSVDFVNENGSYVATFSNFKLEGSYDVVVNIGEDATTEKSVTLTVKNSDNILLDKYVMKGAQATVTPASGDATTVTIGANGELSTKLVNGDYTVSIPGYTTFTFTVSGPAVTAEKTVATTGVTKNATLNEKGGLEESEFTGEQTFADNFNGKIVYAEMVVYLPSDTMSGDKGGVWFGFNSNVTKDGTTTYDTGYTWGMHYDDTDANGKYSADSNYWGIRFGGYWKGFTLTKAQYNMLNSSTGLRIAVAIANNVVYGLLDDGNGELVVSRTMKNQEHFDIWRIGKNTTSKISDVKVATDFASAPSVGRQIGNYETYTNVGTILSHDPNFSVSGNETDGFSVTQKNKSANHVASDGLIPFKMEGNKSISFNFNANDYTGAKIFPSIRLFTNRTDKWQIQLCCWSGSWSLKYPKSINVNPEEKAGAITLGAKFEIKADASGKVAVYMDGNLKVTLAAAASTIVGFDFYNNYDGTNGYKVNCDSAGAITSWSFDNLKLS